MKEDFKKTLDSYRARRGEFRILDVPAMQYLMVDGKGDPNTSQEYADGLRAPVWLWAAGVMGLIVIFTITFATPRIGATATIGLLIAGQLAMGAVIDRFGLFGLEKIPIGWTRLLGIALLALGAAFSLRR